MKRDEMLKHALADVVKEYMDDHVDSEQDTLEEALNQLLLQARELGYRVNTENNLPVVCVVLEST